MHLYIYLVATLLLIIIYEYMYNKKENYKDERLYINPSRSDSGMGAWGSIYSQGPAKTEYVNKKIGKYPLNAKPLNCNYKPLSKTGLGSKNKWKSELCLEGDMYMGYPLYDTVL